MKNKKIEIDIDWQSGHPKMQDPIMLCLKAIGVRIAPPGNSYNKKKKRIYKLFEFLSIT